MMISEMNTKLRRAGTATEADEANLNKLSELYQKAKDASEALNSAKKDSERYQNDLDKEKINRKNAEDKKKASTGDTGTNPKES